MDGLPPVSQSQINAMNKKAEEMFGVDEQKYIETPVERQSPPQIHSQIPTNYMPSAEQAQEYDTNVAKIVDTVERIEVTDNSNDDEMPVKPETNREYNMRVMREDLAREKREREMWQQRAMERQSPQVIEEDDDEEDDSEDYFKKNNLDDDSLVEARHIKELLRRDKEREARQIKMEREYRNEINTMKTNAKLPDFDLVCSQENFTKLRNMNPTLAQTIYNMPDSFEKKELAYSMVKQLGIYKDKEVTPQYQSEDKLQANKNSVKPRAVASVSPQVGESPLMRANAFAHGRSKELDAIALREMREAQMRS